MADMENILYLFAIACIVALFGDYVIYMGGLPPGDPNTELTKASHGAAMMAGAAWWLIGGKAGFPYLDIIAWGFAAWGALWFCVGQARGRCYRDMRIASRSAIRIGLGIALYYYYRSFDLGFWPTFVLRCVALFWIVSGTVKLLLVLRGPYFLTMRQLGRWAYGDSTFDEREEL
jgi:hypothetical protein